MVKTNVNLVRPRTISQDSPSSLSNVHNHRGGDAARKRQRRSCQELFLCVACMFLFILCACLITVLVLVSHSLQSGALLSHCNTTAAAASASTANQSDRNLWYKLLDIATTKIFSNKHLIRLGNRIGAGASNNGDNSTAHSDSNNNNNNNKNNSSSGIDSVRNNSMVHQSKIIDKLSWRLPHEIKPIAYELLLHPDFETQRFSGKVSIALDVIRPISFVAVHAKHLNVTETFLVRNLAADNSTRAISIVHAFAYPAYDYWITELDAPLDTGAYTLHLTFNGNLSGKIVGFYGSSYKDFDTNETRLIATSKFEPTFARQAFPCFDEPAMKAKFKVSLVRPLSYSALSNMNEMSVEEDQASKTAVVHFNTSVPMSTYLACFIVSDFKFKKTTVEAKGIGHDFELRVFATAAQLDKVDFALTTGKAMTEYFIQYFKIEYPLPKLDMAAIPDFVSGAMEHWGLVTFRETSLLYDKATSATNNKQRVAQVVAHELAHMWFGNLVTMKWWNELWLNEGFATYLQFKAMDKVFPDWHVLTDFLMDTMHGVMNLDATLASHPIVQVADTPDQITELFDSITYSKGASVIRMLANYVGEETFAKSVTNYLNKHKYGNAITDDLLNEIDALDEDKDVKRTMATWTKQSGFPVVTVEKQSSTEYLLKQKRFFSNPSNEGSPTNDSEFRYKWIIPVTYVIDSKPTEVQTKVFPLADTSLPIKVPEGTKWIKFNKDQVGYYRVNYAANEWKVLSEALSNKLQDFSTADRAHLLNDAFSLADATQADYEIALNLTKYLAKEMENVPWSVAASRLGNIRQLMSHTENYQKFLQYGRKLIEEPYKSVGWTVDESDLNKNKLRVTILNFACSVGYGPCVKEAGVQFDKWIAKPEQRPSPDLRVIVYYYGMLANGNDEDKWNTVWNLYLKESDAQEKVKIMYGLSAVQSPILLKRFVNLAWDEKNVRGQDYFGCLTNIAGNPIGEPIVWDYVRENWEVLVKRFGLNERYLGRLIPGISSRFTSQTKLDEMKAFFAKHPEAGAGAAARKEALQRIETNMSWLKNNERKVTKWLNENVSALAAE